MQKNDDETTNNKMSWKLNSIESDVTAENEWRQCVRCVCVRLQSLN